MKPPRVGERDAKGRLFLGWKVVMGKGDDRWEIGPDRQWYNAAGCWQPLAGAKSARDDENSRPERLPTEPLAKVVAVYRPESRVRKALRELVEMVERHSVVCELPQCDPCRAIENAKKALGGQR